MGSDKKNRLSAEISPDEGVKRNRIRDIRADGEASGSSKKTLIILGSIAVLAVAAIIIVTTFIYKKPGSFLDQKTETAKTGETFEQPGQEPARKSENIHIQKGKESYSRRYFNDAIAEFNEVLESDASDIDKAIALTYLGMISHDRGDYTAAMDYYTRAMVYDKNNPDIYKNLALAKRHNREYDEAIDNAKKALELRGDDINTRLLLGNIYFEMNRYDDAIEHYSEALKIAPDNASLLYNLGAALLKKGDELSGMEYFKKAGASDRIGEIAFRSWSRLGALYTERMVYDVAEDYLKKAVALRPQDAVARYNLGIAYLRQKKTDLALIELSKSEELGREDNQVLENVAEAYFSMQDYDSSLRTYETILSTNKRNVRVLSRIGEIEYKKGNLDRALEAYRKITLIEPATENARIAYLNMGNILDDTEQYDQAIEAYKKALAINSKDDTAYFNLGIVYKHAEKPELALDSWKRASELNAKDPRSLMAIADYYYEKKLYDLAEKEYQTILQRWPGEQEAHFKMATIYYKRNQTDYARRAYKRVIDINGKSDLARRSLINIAIINSQDSPGEEELEESRNMLNRALLMKPGDPEALFSMGIIHFREEMYDRAIETFYQVIRASRNASMIAEAYNNIGKCRYQKKEYKKALQAFTRAIEEDPSKEEIRINRKAAAQAYEEQLAHEAD